METETTTYMISVRGHLDTSEASEFGGFAFVREINGDGISTTRLLGSVRDQVELHGILDKLRVPGNPIMSLCPILNN